MNSGEIQLQWQKLDRTGLDTLVSWAAEEGWNPGPYDAEVFWSTDPEGYYGFFLNGELLAGGSVVSYNGEFGFMGFFIVQPGFRGKGIGRQLWYKRRDYLLSRLKPGAAIGMDGVVAMQLFYRKGGFEMAFRDERYVRIGSSFPADPAVRPITESDLEAIHAYDTRCFGVPRMQFLQSWLQMPESYHYTYVDEAWILGFAVLRKAGKGYKIGPLFADSYSVAEALYRSCLAQASGEEVFLDIPVNHPGAVKLVREHEATYVFECARMYYGIPPKQALEKIFGITTFELG